MKSKINIGPLLSFICRQMFSMFAQVSEDPLVVFASPGICDLAMPVLAVALTA